MSVQPSLPFDVCARKHGGNAESRAANRRIHEHKESLRNDVLNMYIRVGFPGLTCQEVALLLDKKMHSISARLRELEELGKVVKTSRRRDGGRVRVASRFQKGNP
jgi:hypothetical protein